MNMPDNIYCGHTKTDAGGRISYVCTTSKFEGDTQYTRTDLAQSLADALEEINNWLVCAPIATAEDMAQNFKHMEEVSRAALANYRKGE